MGISLNVIIIGGGLCGLATAIALRNAGHKCTVYEKYAAEAESGAGLVLPTNGTRILRQWGLDLEAAGMVKFTKGVVLRGTTLDVIERHDKVPEAEELGDWYHNTTRPDLRNCLLGEALGKVNGSSPVEIIYDTEVVDYDAQIPAVQFKDLSWRQADLVIACDGIKSKAACYLTGFDSPATPTGASAFRLLIPHEHLMRSPMLRELCASEKDAGTVWFAVEQPGRFFVWWSSHFNQLHSFDIVIPDNESFAGSEDWPMRCDKKVLLKEFEQWHPIFREILLTVDDDPLLWKICAREPLDILHKGRLCIFGDALHPMPPNRAQGVSQAIEDAAAAAEICLSDLQSESDIPARLKLLEDLRRPRYASVQLMSQVKQGDPQTDQNSQKSLEKYKKYFEPGQVPNFESPEAIMSWLLKYDVQKEARAALMALQTKQRQRKRCQSCNL